MIIKNLNLLKKAVARQRAEGKQIVLTQGSWDLVHIGHARYLKRAREHGDFLIVGIDSDKKIKHRKGPDRPIVPQDERMEMLTHIQYVDLVVLKELNHPKWHLIKLIAPDVLIAVEGTYTNEQVRELRKLCGRVVILPRQATTSTSAKIRHLQMNLVERLSKALTPRIIDTIEEVFADIKQEKDKRK